MSEKQPRDMIPSSGGILNDLTNRIKLILRLLADERVSPLVKVIPLGTVIYFFFFPDLAPGPLDDAAVLWLGMYLFIELCPPEVVEEHVAALGSSKVPSNWRGPARQKPEREDEDVVDSDYREM